MSKLEYGNDQELRFGGQALGKVLSQKLGPSVVPAYVYSRQGLQDRAQLLRQKITQNLSQEFSIHYAMKANAHPEVLSLFKTLGFGVDVVSGGELS